MQLQNSTLKPSSQARVALFAGGVAAVLASSCCLGQLILILLGFSGVWIGNLTALERYRPYFIGVALVALFFAWQRIWRPTTQCLPGEACAMPQVRRSYQVLFGLVAFLVAIALAFPFIAPLFY